MPKWCNFKNINAVTISSIGVGVFEIECETSGTIGNCDIGEIDKITILEANLKYNSQIVVGYAKNTTASYILKDICWNNGFYIKKLDLMTDFRFETGYSAKGNILDIIKK